MMSPISFEREIEQNISCIVCKKNISFSKEIKKPLIGDVFIQYTCAFCSPTKRMISERFVMNWPDIIYLILYHLHQTDKNKIGFFRWREDICRLIEERWDDLCPNRNRALNWANSVSSVLSAHPNLFESGHLKMKGSGWWALKHITPPKLPETGTDRKSGMNNNAHYNAITTPLTAPSTPEGKPLLLSSSGGRLSPLLDISSTSLISADTEPTATVISAAEEIKRKLVERLMKVDSKLLRAALIKTEDPPADPAIVTITPASLVRPSSSSSSTGKISKTRGDNSKSKTEKSKRPKPAHYVRASPHENELYESCNKIFDPDENIMRIKRKLYIRRIKRRFGLPLFDVDVLMYNYLKIFDHVCPLPDQMEKLKADSNKSNNSNMGGRDGEIIDGNAAAIATATTNNNTNTNGSLDYLPEGERLSMASSSFAAVEGGGSSSMEFMNIPYLIYPSMSFRAKIEGVSNVMDTYPTFITSPYSGARLPPFIWRDRETKPQRMKLLQEIASSRGYKQSTVAATAASPISIKKNTNNGNDDPSSSAITIDTTSIASGEQGEEEREKIHVPSSSIDYIYLGREFVKQVNALVNQFFWPENEITESLEYPDYSIIAIYKKLVIGFSLINPDGYLAYLFVHPAWSGNNIAQKLLYFSIKFGSPKDKDIVAHVSPSNISACTLYQKFGFKSEEYVIDFYEKYYEVSQEDTNSNNNNNINGDSNNNSNEKWIGWPELLMGPSRNALFIRLRRIREGESRE